MRNAKSRQRQQQATNPTMLGPHIQKKNDDEDNNRKEKLIPQEKPAAAKAASFVRTTTTQPDMRQMRSSYADAFLARCVPLDLDLESDDYLNLPNGVYICPWMSRDPEEEDYYECGNTGFCQVHPDMWECRACGETFEKGSILGRHHKWQCLDQIYEKVEVATAKAEEALDLARAADLSNYKSHIDECENFQIQRDHFNRLFHDVSNDRWITKVTERGTLPEGSDVHTQMDYWASRCLTKRLPLFDAEVMRRPDISYYCSNKIKVKHNHKKMDFGSHCFQSSLLPTAPDNFGEQYFPCAIQTTWAPLNDFLNPPNTSFRSPRYRLGINYTKESVWSYNQRQTYRGSSRVLRPFTPTYAVPSGGINFNILVGINEVDMKQHGGPDADVWTTHNDQLTEVIKPILDKVSSLTNDRPIPRYQMIIDPNQFVTIRKTDGNRVWVPCEFDISEEGNNVTLVGGDRAHWMDSTMIDTITTPVLTAALPLLAKLTKPHLLLEGQRLQVVVKAQSITVPKKQPDDDPPDYIGLWHIDGEHEAVAAIVLYYYDVDEALLGGNMEFMDRRPVAVLGVGDTGMPGDFPTGHLRQALRPEQDDNDTHMPSNYMIPNCSVPIKAGTLLVFSNYQMVHRVLRMVNTSENRPASRKFVALFVLDPAAERLVPARCHLAHCYLYLRALTGKCGYLPSDSPQQQIPHTVAELVLEYLGIVPSLEERRRTRNAMLKSQLTPKKMLGGSKFMVNSTGNGCLTMIGWIDSMLEEAERGYNSLVSPHGDDADDNDNDDFKKPKARINSLNFPPIQVGRGLSETLSIPSDDLNFAMFSDTIDEREEQLNADMDKML